LFELSKIEEGKLALNKETIDLQEVLENVVDRVHIKAREKEIELDVKAGDTQPFVYGDGLRMEQIFNNLLENAIRYTEQGSVQVKIDTKQEQFVKVIIEDTGKGIPKDDLAYIFDRFYRVEKSRAREFGGTGLGLAIVKHLVELQDGVIKVYSEVESGTRFEICFPTVDN
jgi:signal transduction histidine kinase